MAVTGEGDQAGFGEASSALVVVADTVGVTSKIASGTQTCNLAMAAASRERARSPNHRSETPKRHPLVALGKNRMMAIQ